MAKLINIKLYKAIVLIEDENLVDDYTEYEKGDTTHSEFLITGFKHAEQFKDNIYWFLDNENYKWDGKEWYSTRIKKLSILGKRR